MLVLDEGRKKGEAAGGKRAASDRLHGFQTPAKTTFLAQPGTEPRKTDANDGDSRRKVLQGILVWHEQPRSASPSPLQVSAFF